MDEKLLFPRINRIAFYPIKGCAGIELEYAILTQSGIISENYADHEFMIVRAEPDSRGVHNPITQRDSRYHGDKPQSLSVLALIKPEITDGVLNITWDYEDPISIPCGRDQGKELPVSIWEHQSLAIDQGNHISEWLSNYLDLPVRLVKAAGPFERKARQNYMANKNLVNFPDAYPIHWFSEESVQELSRVAGEDIPWQAFRPQIVVNGIPSSYEHEIHSGKINGLSFVDPKPCDRCPVTNVDQDSAKVKVGRALRHLAKYKNWTNKDGGHIVIFGENMLPLEEGLISVGDKVEFVSKRDPPIVYG